MHTASASTRNGGGGGGGGGWWWGGWRAPFPRAPRLPPHSQERRRVFPRIRADGGGAAAEFRAASDREGSGPSAHFSQRRGVSPLASALTRICRLSPRIGSDSDLSSPARIGRRRLGSAGSDSDRSAPTRTGRRRLGVARASRCASAPRPGTRTPGPGSGPGCAYKSGLERVYDKRTSGPALRALNNALQT